MCYWLARRMPWIPPHKGKQRRAKLDFNTLNDAKVKVRNLAEKAGIDFKYKKSDYPHFYYIDDKVKAKDLAIFDLERSAGATGPGLRRLV